MKFLHTGDLHLDSAFCMCKESESAARRSRQRELLRKIFELASSEQCDMVLIAGDLFDSTYVTPETRRLCISLFEQFEKPIVISPGNHDPYVDGSLYKSGELPENVWVFTSQELQFFDFPKLDVTVAGFAFTSSSLTKDPLAEPLPVRHNGNVLLLCAHGDVDMPMSHYAPMHSSKIARGGFDYAALGHVHKYTQLADNIRYCGFAEGRAFDELGEGGVLLVQTDGVTGVTVERRIISEKIYLWEELALTPDVTPSRFDSLVREKISSCSTGGEVYLRLQISGTASFDVREVLGQIKREQFEGLCLLETVNRTLFIEDISVLERDTTLKGEFYRSLLPQIYSEDSAVSERAKRALYIGLAAIDGKDFTAVR